jgi:hypothetical protein
MDVYDGAEWTEMDIHRASIERGSSIEQAAEFSVQVRLGVDEVARKCKKSGNGGSL